MESQAKISRTQQRNKRCFDSDIDSRLELTERRVRKIKLQCSRRSQKVTKQKYLFLFNFIEYLKATLSSFRNLHLLSNLKPPGHFDMTYLLFVKKFGGLHICHCWYNFCFNVTVFPFCGILSFAEKSTSGSGHQSSSCFIVRRSRQRLNLGVTQTKLLDVGDLYVYICSVFISVSLSISIFISASVYCMDSQYDVPNCELAWHIP